MVISQAISAASVALAAAQAAVSSTDALHDLEADLRAQCARGAFSGYVLAVRGDERVMDFGCAPEGLEQPRPDTLFKLFSTSKIFTGALIQSLAADGLVALDAPITTYISPAPASWDAITVDQLLHHNSGMRDHTGALLDRYTEHGAQSHAEAMTGLIAALAEEGDELASEPGGDFAYNNFGYELLVEIGRRATGEDSADLIESRILQPA